MCDRHALFDGHWYPTDIPQHESSPWCTHATTAPHVSPATNCHASPHPQTEGEGVIWGECIHIYVCVYTRVCVSVRREMGMFVCMCNIVGASYGGMHTYVCVLAYVCVQGNGDVCEYV